MATTYKAGIIGLGMIGGADPESGAAYTVKRYSSEKATADDSTFRHLRIVLSPINPEFEPIELTAESEGEVMVVAELLEVLRR